MVMNFLELAAGFFVASDLEPFIRCVLAKSVSGNWFYQLNQQRCYIVEFIILILEVLIKHVPESL